MIDPLASLNLGPLVKTLSQKHLIFHGADFDIRILRRFHDFEPRGLFDTMIAAQLLGYEKQGLADLAKEHCGVSLSKSSQKADWSIRPLNEALLLYAANDTRYLKPISLALEHELESLGRSEWHAQSCAKLLNSLLVPREDKSAERPAWQVKGSKELKGKALAILKALWFWREEEARRRDRPSFKIVHSETLVEIVKWSESHRGMDIASWPQAPRNIKGEYREVLNRLLEQSQDLELISFVTRKKDEKWQKPDAQFKEKLLRLKEEREKIAGTLKIHPSLLATNALLEALTAKLPKTREEMQELGGLMPWQAEILAVDFLKILSQ